ncbi:MAG: hypothetical protein J7578_17555, partial [Chitinophagaceae bacterium]|nr:hypothetical protein [Chitinophagaceae bacterium]
MKPKVAIIYNSGSTSTSFIVMFYTLKDDGKLEYCGDPYDLETKEEVMDKIASEAPSVVQLSVSLFYGMMELLMRTRSCLPKARILVKASYWQDAERAQAFRNGANACIHDS